MPRKYWGSELEYLYRSATLHAAILVQAVGRPLLDLIIGVLLRSLTGPVSPT
jgi:hypothetical protein